MEKIQILQEERIEIKTPEAELWRAVIDQAINDLSDPDLGEATVEWFTSASDRPGTFRWICDHLNLNASAVWTSLAQRESRKKPACAPASHKRRKPDDRHLCLGSKYFQENNRKTGT
jgi:hypothetical protein